MATPSITRDRGNKVVVAFTDGRRLKGYIYNFSPFKNSFRLFPSDELVEGPGVDVEMSELKAVFFVKEFAGQGNFRESAVSAPSIHARKIEVTFADGEELLGTTQGYDPNRLGFFVFSLDSESNNTRIFVVNQNVRHVRWV